jgi:hypothetical protein
VISEHLHTLEDFGDEPVAHLRQSFRRMPLLNSGPVAEGGLGW